MIHNLKNVFDSDVLEVRNEALWIVYNVLSTYNTHLIRKLINSNIITVICNMGEEIYKAYKLQELNSNNLYNN